MEYTRNPSCECSKYVDIDTIDFSKRKSIKDFWMKGYIYVNGSSIECDCHRKFRLRTRYDILANQFGLEDSSTLSQMKYLGTGNSFKRLKEVPKIAEAKNLKDLLVFIHGADGNQKTTSVSKVICNLVTDGKTAEYVLYNDLLEKMSAIGFDGSELLKIDWLFIDDCFSGETINFKNVHNSFFNLILKRKKPTVLVSHMNREEIMKSDGKPFCQKDMLTRVFNKVDKYKSEIEFNDNVGKITTLENGPVDLWSL